MECIRNYLRVRGIARGVLAAFIASSSACAFAMARTDSPETPSLPGNSSSEQGASPAAGVPQSQFDHTHKLFTSDLKRYVEGDLVHYKRWKKHHANLDKYLKTLADLDKAELDRFSRLQKKAFWLNAYNAATIKVVLDHYPISDTTPYYPSHSLRQIPDVWENSHFTIAGQDITLYQIEHDVLRRDFADPRLHFAACCAAKDCGPLKERAYTGDDVDKQLHDLADTFIQNKSNVDFDMDKKTVRVSKIFDWFPLDFARAAGFDKMTFPPPKDEEIVLAYIVRHAAPDMKEKLADPNYLKQFKVQFKDYDWSLNDADATAKDNSKTSPNKPGK